MYPLSKITKILVYEKVKTYPYSHTDVDTNELINLSGLTELETKSLLVLLQKK